MSREVDGSTPPAHDPPIFVAVAVRVGSIDRRGDPDAAVVATATPAARVPGGSSTAPGTGWDVLSTYLPKLLTDQVLFGTD